MMWCGGSSFGFAYFRIIRRYNAIIIKVKIRRLSSITKGKKNLCIFSKQYNTRLYFVGLTRLLLWTSDDVGGTLETI